MEITSNFISKTSYFESKNISSINLNYSNNYCLYSLETKILPCYKLLFISDICYAIFLLILTTENHDTVLFIIKSKTIQSFFYFCHNALIHGYKCFINV